MSVKTRRYVWTFLILAALMAPSGLAVSASLSQPQIGHRAINWVQSLSAAERAAALTTMSALPNAYRRVLYTVASPAQRSDVWRRQAVAYRKSHPSLTSEQGEALEVMVATASTVVLGRTISAGDRAKIAEMDRQMRKAFGADAKSILGSLGPSDADPSVREPLKQRIIGWVADHVTVRARRVEDCGCSTESDWCYPLLWECKSGGCNFIESECVEVGEACIPVIGCGTFLAYDCNGLCKFIWPEE